MFLCDFDDQVFACGKGELRQHDHAFFLAFAQDQGCVPIAVYGWQRQRRNASFVIPAVPDKKTDAVDIVIQMRAIAESKPEEEKTLMGIYPLQLEAHPEFAMEEIIDPASVFLYLFTPALEVFFIYCPYLTAK